MENKKTTVTIKNHAFNPASLEVGTGEEVVWKNEDLAPHTVVSDPEGQAFKSGIIIWKANFSHQFQEPGEYDYHCTIHPQMHGKVTVK
jgi:plastocyanin